jgi:hypothetical protein
MGFVCGFPVLNYLHGFTPASYSITSMGFVCVFANYIKDLGFTLQVIDQAMRFRYRHFIFLFLERSDSAFHAVSFLIICTPLLIILVVVTTQILPIIGMLLDADPWGLYVVWGASWWTVRAVYIRMSTSFRITTSTQSNGKILEPANKQRRNIKLCQI